MKKVTHTSSVNILYLSLIVNFLANSIPRYPASQSIKKKKNLVHQSNPRISTKICGKKNQAFCPQSITVPGAER
jgi:hypothetical protein